MTTTDRPQIDLPPTGPPFRKVVTFDDEHPAQKPYGDTYRTDIVTIRRYDWEGRLVIEPNPLVVEAREAHAAGQITDERLAEVEADPIAHLVADAIGHVCRDGAQFDELTTAMILGNRWLNGSYSVVNHSNMDSHFRGWWGDLKVLDDYTVSITHTTPNCD